MSIPNGAPEFYEKESTLRKKAKATAELIKKSKHFVAFSGAGVSTSAGISDFRGPDGVWTRRDQGLPPARRKPVDLMPTYAHMAMVALFNAGYLKHNISQNCDGLWIRSGFSPESMSELHGNTNLEECRKCGEQYYRNFGTRDHNLHVHKHKTGRICDSCGSALTDTIINFGEGLNGAVLSRAEANCTKADLVLVLGTSMKVTPACDLPLIPVHAKTGKLVLVNKQETPADRASEIRVYAGIDEFMEVVIAELGLVVQQPTVQFQVEILYSPPTSDFPGRVSVTRPKTVVPAPIPFAVKSIGIQGKGVKTQTTTRVPANFELDDSKAPTRSVTISVEWEGILRLSNPGPAVFEFDFVPGTPSVKSFNVICNLRSGSWTTSIPTVAEAELPSKKPSSPKLSPKLAPSSKSKSPESTSPPKPKTKGWFSRS